MAGATELSGHFFRRANGREHYGRECDGRRSRWMPAIWMAVPPVSPDNLPDNLGEDQRLAPPVRPDHSLDTISRR